MSGLYIHIPFCVRKCDYCAFYSVVSKDWKKEARFFQSLETEIENIKSRYPGFSPDTVFVGGGTPTAVSFQGLEKFFPTLGKFSPAEFSVEVNPGTVDAEKLSLLKRSGVNRLSIGVQSFDFQCLETLGRIHSAEQAETAFRLARAAGFDNISIDLMFGTPGQTMAMLDADLDRALALGPEHIAIYNLMYEEGTPLAKRTERSPVLSQSPRIEKKQFAGDRQLDRLDEELEREMYDRIRARLKKAGFVHYEISNFSKPGYECKHNLLYWTGGEYIGCGPAAHSHWRGMRWANVADLDDYCRGGGSPGGLALPMDVKLSGRARPLGEPLPKRKKLPHEIPSWVQQGGRHFITINCKTRDSERLIDHADQLLKSAEYYEQIGRWYLWLMVIMPDHIHFIATFKLSDGVQKTISSWKRYQTVSTGIEWQSDFFEHRLRNEAEFDEKCQYIRMNPVRKGLSAMPAEWPHVLDRISINSGSVGDVALPADAKLPGRARSPSEPKRVPAQQSTTAPPEVSPYLNGFVGDVALPADAKLPGRARSPSEPQSGIASQLITAPPEVSPYLNGSVGDVALPKNAVSTGRARPAERAEEWPRREFEETLDPEAKASETLVMGLRLIDGVEVSPALFEKQRDVFQKLEEQGLLKRDGTRVRLTEEALFVSDAVFAELI